MRDWITEIIDNFIRECEKNTVTKWGSPIVGFADAGKAEEALPRLIPGHGRPSDILDDAKIIISYYVPFLKDMADTNRTAGLASEEWARAYEETNAMLGCINQHLINELQKKGYKAAVHPEAGRFDKDKLVSCWSHRHIAYMAGLGTFGVNNMLITEHGCCGRYSTVITDIDVDPDLPMDQELCGFKRDGSCGACMKKCPMGALTAGGFDRHRCYEKCLENAAVYTSFGSSYTEEGEQAVGSEVCGKCVAGMPCAFL